MDTEPTSAEEPTSQGPPSANPGAASGPPSPWKRRAQLGAAGLVLAFLLLLIPDPEPAPPLPAGGEPYVWDQNDVWQRLQHRFERQRQRDPAEVAVEVDAAQRELDAHLDALAARRFGEQDAALDELEVRLALLAPSIAVTPDRLPRFAEQLTRVRQVIKDASRDWHLAHASTRERLYRLLYGTRMLLEELLLQAPGAAPGVIHGRAEPSGSPSAVVKGVTIHSGDLLVSRGGAPTSALIARGSDYPGNFSHVALAHVDEAGEVLVIESLIETGVVVNTAEQYLADKKLRIMVLRPRSDLLPKPDTGHAAASAALANARARHIPYDFAMDQDDPSEQFCSEVASSAYGLVGIELWQHLTCMSAQGLCRWLAGFGVTRFVTHGPSDLEYDPQLVVVAEWRDPDALWQDHVDNAVVDALLESAEAGEEIEHDWYLLPPARVAKGISAGLNLVGARGPIPEGMSATRALRALALDARHAEVRERTLAKAAAFETERGYRPPYWELVRLARESR